MNRQRLLVLCVMIGLMVSCGGKPTATPTLTPTTILEPTSTPTPAAAITPTPESLTWSSDAVLYEIFPRSFYDSSGDGVGDLRGITSKLDYIQALGANTLWLMPVFSSTTPSGFEVTDFYTIAPDLGTKDNLAELARQAHSRKMRVVLELVIVYTSNESPQFKEAYGKLDSRYSDWYQWSNKAHTAYKSFQDIRTRPLLNLENPAVRTYLFQVAQYWLGVGVDGFRLGDVISVPHEFWKMFRRAINQVNPGAIMLGEVLDKDWKKLVPYFQDEFDALFDVPLYYALAGSPDRNGGGLLNGRGSPGDLDAALAATQLYGPKAQLVRFAGAHNTNRIASLVGLDAERKRMAAVLILTLPGMPLIYYGDEIGMPGSLGTGSSAEEYRRAPMDWTKSSKGAGVPTWFKDAGKVNKPDDGISVEEQQNAKDSLWSLYQMLATHRAGHTALRSSNFQAVNTTGRSCYAYVRWDANGFYLVALNFSDQTQTVTLDLTQTPRAVTGPGQDLLRAGVVSLPSDGRYTLTMAARETRVFYWGK